MTATVNTAPAAIDRKTTAKNGVKRKPPSHAPKIVGTPAIKTNEPSFAIDGRPFAKGAAMAIPSEAFCKVNPTIRNALNAIAPRPTAAPIASPSPKLCSPMPIEIINAIANGFT